MFKHLYIFRVAIFVLLLSLSGHAQAVRITSTESYYEPGGVRLHFAIHDWGSGDHRLCEDMAAIWCTLQVYAVKYPGAELVAAAPENWGIGPRPTQQEVRKELEKAGFTLPRYGSVLVPAGTPVTDLFCLSFGMEYRYPGLGDVIAPAGPCEKLILPALQCNIKGSTTINHHDVSSAAISGNEAEIQLQLVCTGTSSVIASTGPDHWLGVRLRTDEELYSKLTIDGQSTADGVSIAVAEGLPTNITLKSTLVAKGTVTPGEFYGSTVLTLSPP